MSIFNLNEMSTMGNNTIKVFNNGIAGKVENVTMRVTKKGPEEGERNPDYKMIYTDQSGSELTDGFYYNRVQNKEGVSEEDNKKKIQGYINRILSITNTIVPEGFQYPEVNNGIEAMDTLFQIIKDNSEGKKVNIFTTYGTKDYASIYLGVRYFDFIEKGNHTGFSRLVPKGDDLMERMVSDQPKQDTPQNDTKAGGPAW